jgi:hypothetical protein
MRVRTTVEHYKGDQRMSENLKNTLEEPNTSVDNSRTLLKKTKCVRATEEHSRRGQCVCGQPWNTTNTIKETNERAENCITLKNESMRVPATAYHHINTRLYDCDCMIII